MDNFNGKKFTTGVLHFSATLSIIILIFSINKCSSYKLEKEEVSKLYESANTQLQISRNKLGEEVAKTTILTTTNAKLFTTIEFKDKDIQHLQQVVSKAEKQNKELSTALYLANQTIIKYQDSIKNLIIGWEQDSNNVQYPIYTRDFKIDSCYTSGNIKLGLKTFQLDLQVDNDYDVIIGKEKISWFKYNQFAEITNKNKCTTTKTMKVYDKKEQKTNIIKPFGIGVGVGAIGLLLLSLLL